MYAKGSRIKIENILYQTTISKTIIIIVIIIIIIVIIIIIIIIISHINNFTDNIQRTETIEKIRFG